MACIERPGQKFLEYENFWSSTPNGPIRKVIRSNPINSNILKILHFTECLWLRQYLFSSLFLMLFLEFGLLDWLVPFCFFFSRRSVDRLYLYRWFCLGWQFLVRQFFDFSLRFSIHFSIFSIVFRFFPIFLWFFSRILVFSAIFQCFCNWWTVRNLFESFTSRAHKHTHTHTHTHKHTDTDTYTHTRTHTQVCVSTSSRLVWL